MVMGANEQACGDGTPDDQEDFDQDGLSNASEFLAGTDPTEADSDGDGIVDSRDARATIFDGERAVCGTCQRV